MRRSPRSVLGAVLAATALLATGALAGTAGAAPASGPEPIGHSAATTTAQQEQVRSHWTADRMRAAVPIEELAPEALRAAAERSAENAARTGGTSEAPQGEPRKVAPTSPTAGPTAVTKREVGAAEFPQTGAPWVGEKIESTAGRVFFTYDGRSASCSGNAVTSGNASTVLTAGHCVKLDGAWHEDWVFVPGYTDGSAPFGEWPALSTHSTPQWEASEDMNYDVGAAKVAETGGELLTEVVGSQGLAFNTGYDLDAYAFGYPAADPYDGETFIYCSGTTFKDPLLTTAHGLGCDMTGGSSGGPWLVDFDEETGTGLQASVNSFGYVFLPGNMFGPHFGAEAEALYESVQSS
ncbi:peptidase [Streptomyces sp. XM4193]|uniref:trypsin-like serine peptidase n=1 Tax=Streptomyces sp. XM4193 TaxID=2929782 RepID=UPI001FF761AD|nr:peptidase [Streptomyces sp. XM4193]MCK1795578.1 peptidase [Streptomyces sp. XM4193]